MKPVAGRQSHRGVHTALEEAADLGEPARPRGLPARSSSPRPFATTTTAAPASWGRPPPSMPQRVRATVAATARASWSAMVTRSDGSRPTRAGKPDRYLIGSYRIATAPEPNPSNVTLMEYRRGRM